jgi:hypothetical protein
MHSHNYASRASVLEAVLEERDRQDKLWGSQRQHSDAWWNVIASEENGEVAREVYEDNQDKLFIELIQACAVYFAWAEAVHEREQDEKDR